MDDQVLLYIFRFSRLLEKPCYIYNWHSKFLKKLLVHHLHTSFRFFFFDVLNSLLQKDLKSHIVSCYAVVSHNREATAFVDYRTSQP